MEDYMLEVENEHFEYLSNIKRILYNYLSTNIEMNIKIGKRKFKIRRMKLYIKASKTIKKFEKNKLKKTINRLFGYKNNYDYKKFDDNTVLINLEKNVLETFKEKYNIEIEKKYYKFRTINIKLPYY